MSEADTDGLVWTLESTHFPAPVTRWCSALFTGMQTEVLSRLAAESGLLYDGVAYRELEGRVYTTVVPLGGRLRKPPPRWLVPVLCRVAPQLRRRLAAAHAADVTDLAGKAVDEWEASKEDDLLERGRAFLAGDLSALSAEQVALRLEEQLRFIEECFTWHFRLLAAGADTIGRLGLELTTQHGWSVAELMDLFVGLSATTTDPAEAQHAIVALVEAAEGRHILDTATSLRDVAGISPQVAAALQGYQDLWGQRAVRYEVAYPTVVERPEWLLRQLKDTARGAADEADVASRHAATRARSEARFLATVGNSSAARRRLARARRVFPLREGNEAATIGVPLAGLRRLGLHVGVRLGLYRPDDVFDLTFDEVITALRSPDGEHNPADQALERREGRVVLAGREPAPELGSAPDGVSSGPPDLRGFPRAAAEQLAAVLWYTSQVTAPLAEDRLADQVLRGLGVAPGVYDGTARIIRDEDDFERLQPGDVLVCRVTSPVWSMIFPALGALVCDAGGAMSHPAIIAREFGIPAVVATGTATTAIPDGSRVRVDGRAGTVTLIG